MRTCVCACAGLCVHARPNEYTSPTEVGFQTLVGPHRCSLPWAVKPHACVLQPQLARLCAQLTHPGMQKGRVAVTTSPGNQQEQTERKAQKGTHGTVNPLLLLRISKHTALRDPLYPFWSPFACRRDHNRHLSFFLSHRRLQDASQGKRNNLSHGFLRHLGNGCLRPGGTGVPALCS